MGQPRSRRLVKLGLEVLEDRTVPAPVPIGNPVPVDGANSPWDYSDGADFTPSPVFADIDNDGRDEALVVQGNRQLYAYRYTSGDNFVVHRVFATGQAAELHSTPVVVNLPGGVKGVFIASMNGTVFGWNGATGANLPGWPSTIDVPNNFYPLGSQPNKVFGSLASGDLDGDGSPEIVVTSFNQHVTALRADGSVMWRYANDDSVLSGVAIGDLDRDGKMEVVLGGDSSNNAFYNAGGHITALSFDGRRRWTRDLPQIVQSSPVLADIDGDGTLEVFAGTGVNFSMFDNSVYGLDNAGNILPGWPYRTDNVAGDNGAGQDRRVLTGPAIGDVDLNGVLDIVFSDRSGRVHAVRPNGTAIWVNNSLVTGGPLTLSTPLIADIDNDNDPDVIQLVGITFRAFDGATGAQTWNTLDDGTALTGRQYLNSAAIGHFKGDATWQLVALGNGIPAGGGSPLSPTSVRFFDLGSTTLTPPWSHIRQSASGNPVSRPNGFIDNYLTSLATYIGRTGAGINALIADWKPTFRHAQSLNNATLAIIGSAEARAQIVRGWYQTYLGRAAEDNGIFGPGGWIEYLSLPRTYAQAQASIVASQEAFNNGGMGTNAGWVRHLYMTVLGRAPQGGEDNTWIGLANQGVQRFDIAIGFFFSQEFTEKVIRNWYQSFGLGAVPADSLFAASFDLRRGVTEETVLQRLLSKALQGGGSDYVATQQTGSWIRQLYADVLQRGASAQDVASWLQNIERGTSLDTVANAIVRSNEHHALLVRGYYTKYLRRNASEGEVAIQAGFLNSGGRREDLIKGLVASQEYFNLDAGNQTLFITRAFVDILGHGPDATQQALWLSRPDFRTGLPESLLTSEEYYFNTIKNSYFMPYLRRFPHTPANQSALFNVPPGDFYAPVRPFINHLNARGAQADIEVSVLLSPEYFAIAFHKAIWGGNRWK